MKKLLLLLLIFTLSACGQQKESPNTYEYKYMDNSGNEQIILIDLILENGKIKEIEIDETYGDSTKKTLGDKYGMSAYGLKEWDDQIRHLEKELVGTDGKIALDDKGYPTDADVTSGCTINLSQIQKAVLDAIDTMK